ncbi:pseudouridine synthase [Fuscibacter oryzae]|uniref:pseudouridine synthase n=1 Tax=Fuscibacter oryzae TaxID=2803939 RepID=UPI001F48CD2B
MRIEFTYTPPDVPLNILYQDAQIIVANKPEGLLSVPGKLEGRADCLITRLQAEYWDALVVHRLDCDTSGVMIFARTKQAQGFLGQEFEHRRAKKTYVARVLGEVAGEAGRIDLPLSVDWPNRPRQMVNFDQGKPALTDWQVIGRAPGETRMQLSPLTGRSHQLRVHMLELGHPILGDQIYAPETRADHSRLMLHAETLGLHHPETGNWMSFTADCPF